MQEVDTKFKTAFNELHENGGLWSDTVPATDEESSAMIGEAYARLSEYKDAQFSDTTLGEQVNTLRVLLKALQEIKNAQNAGLTMDAADLTVATSMNDMAREIQSSLSD